MRLEQWIFDSPDQAGAAFREFVTLVLPGKPPACENQLEIGGRRIDLRALEMPI